MSAAEVLLSRPDWIGLGAAPFSTMATQGLLAAQQSKNEIEAGLTRAAMDQLGASARQKNASDASIKINSLPYDRSQKTSLAQKLALISQVGGLGGGASSTAQANRYGAELIANAGSGGLGAPAQRMAGGVQAFQGLLNTTDPYQDAARGVAAQAVANIRGMTGFSGGPALEMPAASASPVTVPAATVGSIPWSSLFQPR